MNSRPASEALGLRFEGLPSAAKVSLALSIAALWMLGRRYEGLVHDAILYAGIGLRRLNGAALDSDLFFTGGAQDTFTYFPALYARAIDALGMGPAALACTVVGQIAFVAAAAALIWRIAPAPARWWSLALLAAVSGYYGGVGVFRFAEPFATARSFAEPLVLVALACTLRRRPAAAVVALVAAALLHPLVAAPGVAVVCVWHALGSVKWRRYILPAFVTSGLALAATALWPAQRFDAEWLAPVQQRSPHLFLSLWLAPDWSRLVWGLCVTGIASRIADADLRRLLAAAAAVLAGALACTVVIGDILGSAFVAALQLWRAHWILHLLALVLVPVAAVGLWAGGSSARAAAVLLVASVCFGRFGQPAALALAFLAVIFVALEVRRVVLAAWGLKVVALVASCVAAIGLLFELQARLPLEYSPVVSASWEAFLPAAVSVGGLLPLGALLLLLSHSRRTGIALLASFSTFAFALSVWDARASWRRFLEAPPRESIQIAQAMAPNAQVLWPAPGIPSWLVLGRPSWYSVDQGAGIVFNRATAVLYAERERASESLRSRIDNCAVSTATNCSIEAKVAASFCRLRDGPDFLVLGAPVAGHDPVARLPGRASVRPGAEWFYVYGCRALAIGS